MESYATVNNLLANALTTDESQMCNTTAFYNKWQCYWKNGEAAPESNRPKSIFSKVFTKTEYGSQLFAYYPNTETTIFPNMASGIVLSEDMPIVVLDYPADNDHPDLYYSIPIEVKNPGEYRLTGAVDLINAQTKKYVSKPSDFCTKYNLMLFVADKQPCKKEMQINTDNDEPRIDITDLTNQTMLENAYLSFYGSNAAKIDKVIYLDKDVKYLSIYAPAVTSKSSPAVLALGDLHLEPVNPTEEPEDQMKEPLTFKNFAKCLFLNHTYTLADLGLTTETGFEWQHTELTVSCDNTELIEISGSGANTTLTPVKYADFEGYPSPLAYSTLVVAAKDDEGKLVASSMKLYVAKHSQQTKAFFNYLERPLTEQNHISHINEEERLVKTSTTSESNVIRTSSITDSWTSTFTCHDKTGDTIMPDMEYTEASGWKMNFGDNIEQFQLHLEPNMLHSRYLNNPAYVLKDLSINVDETRCPDLKIYSTQTVGGVSLTKLLEPDDYEDEQYYTNSDATITTDIIFEGVGSLVIKNITLDFLCNFNIPMPLFENVNEANATYIYNDNPKDSSGIPLWDSANPLPIQYRIEPDVTSECRQAYYSGEEIESDWIEYKTGEQISFGETEKLTARTLHPHGMVSLPNVIKYSVITKLDNPETEDTQTIEYFNMQGLPISAPLQHGAYIKVVNGTAFKTSSFQP